MMRKHRLLLVLALLVGALSLLAAGCGGDDEEDAGEGTTEAATTEAAENISGSIKIASLWTGGEKDSFEAVLDGFRAKYPDVTVTYQPAGEDLPTILATGVEGGNPPDLASCAPHPARVRVDPDILHLSHWARLGMGRPNGGQTTKDEPIGRQVLPNKDHAGQLFSAGAPRRAPRDRTRATVAAAVGGSRTSTPAASGPWSRR